MEIVAILKYGKRNLLPRLTPSFSRSIRTATATLSLLTKHNTNNQTPAFDSAPTIITPQNHQLLPRDSAPLSSTALLGAVLGSICGVIFFVICCFFYIRFRAWSDTTMTASSRRNRWRRAHYYHDSASSSSTSDSSTSASSRTIPRDVEKGEAWWTGAGVAGGAQRGYGYGQSNMYGRAQTQAQMGYGVGFEGGATGGNVPLGFGNVATGYGPGVAQAPRVPPVATTEWSPHVFRQGNM